MTMVMTNISFNSKFKKNTLDQQVGQNGDMAHLPPPPIKIEEYF